MPKTATDDLYETDFYEWTKVQADGLRLIARERPNLPLDLPRLIEEVEDLGKSERDAVFSYIERVIEHCLKLEYSLSRESRAGWRRSITGARARIENRMSPSIRRQAERALPKLYRIGRKLAAEELQAYAELSEAELLPTACPYTVEQLCDLEWFPEDPHQIPDKRRS